MGQNYPNNMVQKITDLTKLVVNEFPFSKDKILSSWTDEDSKKIADDITNRYCITGSDSINFQHTAISLIRQTMSLIANAYQQHNSILSSVATIRQSIEQEIKMELARIARTPYTFQLLNVINVNREVVLKEIFDTVVRDNMAPSQLEIKEAVQTWIKKKLNEIERTTITPQPLYGIQNGGIYEVTPIGIYQYPNDVISYIDQVNKILTQMLSYYKSASGEYAAFDVVWNINQKLFELKKYPEYARYYYQVFTKDNKIIIDLLDPLQILKNTHIEKPLFYSQNPACVQTPSIYSNPESMNPNLKDLDGVIGKTDQFNMYRYRGTVASFNDLPSEGNVNGDLYFTKTNEAYCWLNGEFVMVSPRGSMTAEDPFEDVPKDESDPEKQVTRRTSNLGYIFPETEKRCKRILSIINSMMDEGYYGISATVISGFLDKTDVKNLHWALSRLLTLGYIQTSPSQTPNKPKYGLTNKGLEYISSCEPVQLCWTKWFKQQFSHDEFQQFVKPIMFKPEDIPYYTFDGSVGAVRKLMYGGMIEPGKKATLTGFGEWVRDQYLKEQGEEHAN